MRDVVRLTIDTLERRAIVYRRIALATLAAMLLAPVGSAVLRAWWPLVGVLAPVPATVLFLVIDRAIVRGWSRGVLALAHQHVLPMSVVADALRQLKFLPQATLEGMLDELLRMEPTSSSSRPPLDRAGRSRAS